LVFGYGFQLAKQLGLPAGEYLGTDSLAGGKKMDARLLEVYVGEGAMRGVDLVKGQWWRLISSFFVHMGIIHIASNLFSLYMVGPLTERMWGSGRYLILYMLAGFAGSCSMAYFSSNPYVVGAGASGAIWGLMTSVITWLLLNRAHMPRPFVNTMLRRLFNVVLLNVFISFIPGISMAAHFGGGAAGVLVSILLHGNRHGRVILKVLSTIGLVLFPLACFAGVVIAQRSDPKWEKTEYELRRLPQMEAARDYADSIDNSKLRPLMARQLQGLSEQELREAIQAEREIVEALQKGVKLAREPPDYKDPNVENARQAFVRSCELRIGEVELPTWQGLVKPAARDELRLAARVFRQKAQPLLTLPPAARQKESLEEAQSALQEQVGKLAGMRELLQLTGPLQSDPELEESRKEEIENLTRYLDLFKIAATGLNEGSSWPEEKRKEYEQLVAKIKERGS
jgi:membrane associated rhomboid family serine protease